MTSIDGMVWVNHESGPVKTEGDSPCVIKGNGIYRLWYNFVPRDKVLTTSPPLYYTTWKDGISWQSHALKPLAMPPAVGVGSRHVSALFCKDHYQLWYDTTFLGGHQLRYISGVQATALDLAQIKLSDLRIVEIKPHRDWSELIVEPAFRNEGPGDAEAVEVKLLETVSGVRSMSPEPTLSVGDLTANQSAWASEPLRLLLQEPPQAADDLDLHWQISYTDTVMGDRQVFIVGSKQ